MYIVFKFVFVTVVFVVVKYLVSVVYAICILVVIAVLQYDEDLDKFSAEKLCSKAKAVARPARTRNHFYAKPYSPYTIMSNSRVNNATCSFSPIQSSNGALKSVEQRITSTPLSSVTIRQKTSNHASPTLSKLRPIFTSSRYSLSDTTLMNCTTDNNLSKADANGPLLASTRYNVNLGMYADCKSPGLSRRIVEYSNEERPPLTHSAKYNGSNIFPIVHFFKQEVPVISPKFKRVTVKIANPDTHYTTYERNRILAESMSQELINSKRQAADSEVSTRSVLDALKEISRKRIHATTDYDLNQDPNNKRQRTDLTNGSIEYNKRSREESPPDVYVDGKQKVKRVCVIDPVMASFSSSQLFKHYLDIGLKRKTTQEEVEEESSVEKEPKKSCTVETQTTEETLKKDESAKVSVEKPQPEKQSMDYEEPQKADEADVTDKNADKTNKKEDGEDLYQAAEDIIVFNDNKLEENRKNKLATLLGMMTGEKAEVVNHDDLEESLTRPSQKPKSILSPQNKPKHEKHVSFNLPKIGGAGDVLLIPETSTTHTENAFITTNTTVTTSVTTPISFGNPLATFANKSPTTPTTSNAPKVGGFKFDLTKPEVSATNPKSVVNKQSEAGGSEIFGGFSPASSALGSSAKPGLALPTVQNTDEPVPHMSFGREVPTLQFRDTFTGSPKAAPAPKSSTTTAPSLGASATKTSTSVFGATNPLLEASQQTAFGVQSPTFGLSSATTVTPSTSAFGITTSSAFGTATSPAFGALAANKAPVTSSFPAAVNSTFGQSAPSPAFAAPSSAVFCAPTTTPAFGTAASSSFGAFGTNSASSAFAAPTSSSSAFGAAATTISSSYGAVNSPAFAVPVSSAFAAPTTSTFAAPTSSAFGAQSTSAFGASNTPSFGVPVGAQQTTSSFGTANSSVFGTAAATSSFGTATSASFGAATSASFGTPTSSAFGASIFGNQSFGGASSGGAFGSVFGATPTTSAPKFGATEAPPSTSATTGAIFGFAATTAMQPPSQFKPKTSSAVFGFGTTTSTSPSAFGSNTSTGFGSVFGTSSTTHTKAAPTFSSFSANAPAFGAPTPAPTVTTSSGFGAGFGAPVTTAGFGNAGASFAFKSEQSFGGVSVTSAPAFGFAAPATQAAPSFGTFGGNQQQAFQTQTVTTTTTTANTGFGVQATPSFGAGANSPGFGSAFGGGATTGFAAQPAFGNKASFSAFGGVATTTSTPAFGFNNVPSSTANAGSGAGVFTFGGGGGGGGGAQAPGTGVFAFGADKAKAGFPTNPVQPPPPTFGQFGGPPVRGFGGGALFNGPAPPTAFNVPSAAGGMFSIGSGTSSPRPRQQLKAKRRTQI